MKLDTYYVDPVVAANYDSVVRTTDDVPFYSALSVAAASRGDDVLELACGTGRVTIPMAQAGARMTRLDNSVAMLHIAERKAESAGIDITWVQGDMASFSVDQRFGLVVIPCRSFLLLTTTEAQKSCLASAHAHLVDGGVLALNIFNPNLAFMAARLGKRSEAWERDGDSSLARREYHPSEQLLVETRRDSFGPSASSRTLRARWVYRYEMQYLLELCGLQVEALYGWFDGRPFDDDSTEMVWLARKV